MAESRATGVQVPTRLFGQESNIIEAWVVGPSKLDFDYVLKTKVLVDVLLYKLNSFIEIVQIGVMALPG